MGQGKLLTIDGDPIFEGDGMFEKGVYLSIFFVEEISVDMVEEQVIKYTDPYLLGEKYFRVSNHMQEHWK